MDPNYKPLQQQADQLHGKFLDYRDDRNDQLSRWLENETKQVREDIEQGKAPRSVESRIQEIQKQLAQAKAQPTAAMSTDDAARLFDGYENMRVKLRGMPNY